MKYSLSDLPSTLSRLMSQSICSSSFVLLEVANLLFEGANERIAFPLLRHRRVITMLRVPQKKPMVAPTNGSHTYSPPEPLNIPILIKIHSVSDSLSTLSPYLFYQCLCIGLKTCVPSNRDSAVKFPSELYHFVYFFVKIIETPAAYCGIFHDFGMRCRP